MKEPTTDKSSRGPSWPGSDSSGAPPGGYSAYHSSQILRGSSVRCVKEPTFDTTSRRPSWPDSDSSGAPPGGYSAYRSSQILRGSSVRCVKEPTSDTTSRGSSWPVSHKGNISLYLVLCITSQILCGDYVTNMKVTNAYHDKVRALLWRMGHYLIALVWAYVLYTINSNDCNGRQMGNSSSQQPVCGNLNGCTSAPQCAVEDFTQRMHLRTAMCVEDFLWNLGLCAARRRRQGNKRSEGTGPCTAASFPKCATSTLRRRTYTSASAAPRERATSKPTELLQANAAAFQRQAQTAATSREVVGWSS